MSLGLHKIYLQTLSKINENENITYFTDALRRPCFLYTE